MASLLLLSALALRAQPGVEGARPLLTTDSLERAAAAQRLDVISVGVDVVASTGKGSFFDGYERLGGNSNVVGVTLAPALIWRLSLNQTMRMIFWGGYMRSTFSDRYAVYSSGLPIDTVPPLGVMVENFNSWGIPLTFGIEYAPIQTQFTSYVGATGGIVFAKAEWTTTPVAGTTGGYSRPLQNMKGFGIGPAFRAYMGVDLRFDRDASTRGSFRGIFLEAAYTLVPVVRDYFAEILAGGKNLPRVPDDASASVNLGGVSITVGLNLQVLRR